MVPLLLAAVAAAGLLIVAGGSQQPQDCRLVLLENGAIGFGESGDLAALSYDGRGGRAQGQMVLGEEPHTAELELAADGPIELSPLRWRNSAAEGRVEQVGLRASQMAGSVDFEAGSMAVRLLLDLEFGPLANALGLALELSAAAADGGRPLGLDGSVRLVGTAPVPATDDDDVNALYGLPTTATFAIEARLDVPDGWPLGVPRCPVLADGTDQSIALKASLSELLIGNWPQMAYDPSYGGVRSGGSGTLFVDTIEDGVARFEIPKDDTAWAPLMIIPASANDTVPGHPPAQDIIFVEIALQEDMAGTIDFCSGAVEMSFDSCAPHTLETRQAGRPTSSSSSSSSSPSSVCLNWWRGMTRWCDVLCTVCTQIIRGEICRHTRPPSCPDGPTARGTQLHNHSNLSW